MHSSAAVPSSDLSRRISKRLPKNGQAVEFITYDEPKKARDYTAAERARRFGRVLVYAAERTQAEIAESSIKSVQQKSRNLHILAHSIGATDGLNTAYLLQDDLGDKLKSVTLLNPIGYAPDGQPQGLWAGVGRAARELLHTPRIFAGLGSVAMMSTLAASITERFSHAPFRTSRMARQAFRADNRERFAEICSNATFAINALAARNDEFYPALETGLTLIDAHLPADRIGILPNATHSSVLTDARNGAAAYHFMDAQRPQIGQSDVLLAA